MAKPARKVTLAYVRWFDSSIYGWPAARPEDVPGVSQMESAGLLLRDDGEIIQLAADRDLEDGDVRLVITIPKGNVISVHKVVISTTK